MIFLFLWLTRLCPVTLDETIKSYFHGIQSRALRSDVLKVFGEARVNIRNSEFQRKFISLMVSV